MVFEFGFGGPGGPRTATVGYDTFTVSSNRLSRDHASYILLYRYVRPSDKLDGERFCPTKTTTCVDLPPHPPPSPPQLSPTRFAFSAEQTILFSRCSPPVFHQGACGIPEFHETTSSRRRLRHETAGRRRSRTARTGRRRGQGGARWVASAFFFSVSKFVSAASAESMPPVRFLRDSGIQKRRKWQGFACCPQQQPRPRHCPGKLTPDHSGARLADDDT